MKIDTFDAPLADDEIPLLTELPQVPSTDMPAARVQARYHSLLREVGRGNDARHATAAGAVAASALRRRSLSWKVAVTGGLALGVLAVTLALGYAPASHGSAADDAALAASWTPTPTTATSAQAHDAAQRCSTAPARIVLAEQRGDVTAVLLASGSTLEGCVVGGDQRLSVALWSASAPNHDFGSRALAMQPFPAAFEVGQVAPDVATATITLTDNRVVTATVADGWAFAWWPGGATAKSVTEYAANGSVVKTLTSR